MDWKLEVVVIPVSDVDRAKQFYSEQLGFNVDVDNRMGESFRNVQLTPPGSACSVTIGTGLTPGVQLVVGDIQAARAELVGRGIAVSPVQHLEEGVWSTGPADRGTRSSSSRIPTATTGPCRKSPWPHERSAAAANHARVVIQSRTSLESPGMKVHEFDAVVGGRGRATAAGRVAVRRHGGLRNGPAQGQGDGQRRHPPNDGLGVRGRSYVGFRKQIQEAAGIRIGDRSGSGSSPTSSLASSRCPTTWPRPSGRIERRAKRSRGSRTPIARNMPSGSKTPRSPRPVNAGWSRQSSCSGPAPSTPKRPLRPLRCCSAALAGHCLRHQGVAASPP